VEIARSFLTPAAYREAALVALSRGTDGNYAYLDTDPIINPDEPETLPGELFYRYRETAAAAEALAAILRREGAELSATEELREAFEAPYRLSTTVPQFGYALLVHRGPVAVHEAEDWVRAGVPEHADTILADEAWPTLAQVLHEARDAGADPVTLLRTRTDQRRLVDDPHDPAQSVAQVLHYRITADMPTARPHPDRPPLLPGWIPSPPALSEDADAPADIADLGDWLRGRAHQIADRVLVLGERAAEHQPAWTLALGPVPDDPVTRAVWVQRAGQVGAYRDRYEIPDTDPVLLPGPGRGEQGRARDWVSRYLATQPLPAPTPPVEVAAGQRLAQRTADLRDRLSDLTRQLGQPHGRPARTAHPVAAHDAGADQPVEPDRDAPAAPGDDPLER
jgi:hypothetical protein